MRKLVYLPLLLGLFFCLAPRATAQGTRDLLNDKWMAAATVEDIKRAIRNRADVNATGIMDETVLMCAAKNNKNSDVLRTLIRAGAKVNEKDEYGRKALMFVARSNRNPEVISTLIRAGANVNAKTHASYEKYPNMTALNLAEYVREKDKGRTEIIRLLRAAGAKYGDEVD